MALVGEFSELLRREIRGQQEALRPALATLTLALQKAEDRGFEVHVHVGRIDVSRASDTEPQYAIAVSAEVTPKAWPVTTHP